MATDAQSSPATSDVRPVSSMGQDFIRRKINSTRRSVKLAELAAGLLLFGAGSILFLLVLALVDHWVVGLGFMSRLAAFLVYVSAAVAFLWIYVVPLLIHSINPLYAARMIEQGQPTLKNSLLNFMFLTQNQQGTRKAVLDAIETQAASDMSSLKLEHLVDFTKAIRIGYVLAALMVLFGLYKVISPKDPLQTAARVLAPWQDIARPSRVKIEDVKPGSTSIYQGESLEVSAKIYDIGSSETVNLVYSTRDGQLVDQTIPLEVVNDGFTYRAMLSTSDNGIQQALTYRIEAGDAVTADFEVTTLEAPSIDVASVRYDFPAYTGEPSFEREGDGHIRALENTMVTLRTIANRPIQKAYLEFDPVEGGPTASLNTIPLQINAESPTLASVRFPLELNEAGTTGKYRSYQVRFRTEDGVLNPHPVLHNIEVLRDLPPEIEWVEPSASEVEVPANSYLLTKLRAIDPDFAIRQLILSGTIDGAPLFAESMLKEPKSGQVVEAWKFVPSKLGLQEGQVVKLMGIAEDTRTDFNGRFQPNRAETRPRIIRITAPVEGAPQANDPSDEQTGGEDQQEENTSNPQADGSGEKGDKGEQGKENQSGDPGDMSEQNPQSEGSEDAQGEKGSKGDSGQDGMKTNSDQSQQGENASENQDQMGEGNPSASQQQEGDANQQDQQKKGEGSDSQESPQSGDPQEGQSENGQGGSSNSQEQSGDQNSQSQGSGGSGGEASSASDNQERPKNQSNQAGKPSGKGTGKPGDPNQGGEIQKGDSSTQPNENSTVERQHEPVASDGSEDGDAFERLQEYLKKKELEQKPIGDKPSPENADPQSGSQPDGPQSGGNETSGDQKPSGENGQNNPGQGSGQPQPDQKNQGSGNSPSGEGSSGMQDGAKPEKGGVDNAAKPENSVGGENMADQEKQEGQPGTTDNNEGEASERDTQNNEQGAGQNKGGATNKENSANESTDSERSGDNGMGDNTNSGSGEPGNEGEKGSPESSADRSNKQRENNTEAEGGESKEEGDAPKSPSNSDQQSQGKKGGERGDQSGDGKSGGGQSSQQAGNDSAGSTSAADQGAGQANQQGKGETGPQGGDGPQAEKQTGSSGKEKGEGSQTTQSSSGTESGSESESSENMPPDSPQNPSDPNQGGRGPGRNPNPQGGGKQTENAPSNSAGPISEPGEDAANMEYAEKATDMVLDKLKHQEGSPDQEMLDELGWSKEDFQKFVERWQKMKQAAEESEPGAKRELKDALRSLGLSRGEDKTRRVEERQSVSGGSSDTQRSTPPPAFLEQYRAYLKGASQ